MSLLLVVVLGIGFAYARYVTTRKGTADAQIANWSVVIILDDKTNENVLIDLANTRKNVLQEAEVQEGYIGPGTAGKFDVVIDARGSDVSLEYKISLDVDNQNNTKFPKNLIFYSDQEMNNAIYHDGSTINLNGFIDWNDEQSSKQVTKTIYWKWAYETGKTQEEIDENDIADSHWMNQPPISLSMNVVGKQVNSIPTTGQYAVTFDANGGTIKGYGNSEKTTKQVTYGSTYGDLPEPTREGYEFLGWAYGGVIPDKTARAWVTQLVGNDFVSSNFLENQNYIFEYDVTINEEIPEGYYWRANGYDSSWAKGLIRLRTGTTSYTYKSLTNISGTLPENYIVGKKYHLKRGLTIEDLPNAILVFYTGRLTDGNGNDYRLNGTFSNIAFYKSDTPHTLDYIFEYRNVTSSTTVGIEGSHTLTAMWKLKTGE